MHILNIADGRRVCGCALSLLNTCVCVHGRHIISAGGLQPRACLGHAPLSVHIWVRSPRIIHGAERAKRGGRPWASWSSANVEGPALIIKTTFTGRISAASVGGCAFQGHVRDNHEEGKVCRGFKKKKKHPVPTRAFTIRYFWKRNCQKNNHDWRLYCLLFLNYILLS